MLTEALVRLLAPMFRVPAARLRAPLVDPAEAVLLRITVALAPVMARPLKLLDPVRVMLPAFALALVTVRLPLLLAVPSAMFTPIVLVVPFTSKTPPLLPMETANVLLPVTVLVAMKFTPLFVLACSTPPLDQVIVLVTPLTALLEL